MVKIWDSTPTRTTGRHRAHLTAQQRINRRALARLAAAAVLLATLLGLAAAAPVALLDLALATVMIGLPVLATLGLSHALGHGLSQLARMVRR